MRLSLCSILLFLSLCPLCADTWFVGFTDKNGTSGSLDKPSEYLSQRALLRRQAQGIGIDSADLPVSRPYLDSLTRKGATVVYTTKWLNGAVVTVSDQETLQGIRALDFVDTMQCTKHDTLNTASVRRHKLPQWLSADPQPELTAAAADEYKTMLGLDSLHTLGFHGQGKMISILDNGFHLVDNLPVFSNAKENIVFTCNLVNQGGSVYDTGTHGAMVFSLIAGVKEDTLTGTATAAEYCLFSTEDDNSESLLEPDNMIRAFELADSVGTDIISVSLGYYDFDNTLTDLTYMNMDGKTARCSRAATIAASKGILLCVAAGNEGSKPWHYIDAPADADNILTVGGVDINRQHSTFSSFGPTADGRVKPDVCTLGTAVPILYPFTFVRHNGTSFATPIMAGAAASLWSALPELTAMQLRERILQYSDRYLTPDSAFGYGIPNLIEAYYDRPTALPTLHSNPGSECLIFDIQGNSRGNDLNDISHLEKGIYIIRQGENVRKIIK